MAVVFRHEPCVPVEEMRRNIAHTKTLGLPEVEYAGNVAVVGGGPSLAGHIDELRAWKGPIWAINGTWAWLKERGVNATFFTIDPRPQEWLKEHRGKALVASIGSAGLFDALSGWNVRTFDIVVSGTTSATAAPHLAVLLGHKSVTFFGCDSSFAGGRTHLYDTARPDHEIEVEVGGGAYVTKPEFLMQAEDLAALCRELPGFHKCRSGGLLEALIAHPTAIADQYLFEAA
jgi:hypothetical protein